MKVLYRLLLFVILIIFCGQVYHLVKHKQIYVMSDSFHSVLYLDYKFNEQEKGAIAAAAHDWEIATHNKVKFKIVELPTEDNIDLTKGTLILKVDSLDPEIILLDIASGGPSILGLCNEKNPIPHIKIVSPRISSSKYRAVVEHELGHLIGLDHINEPDTLMYPTISDGSETITNTDLKYFCKKYNC